MCTNQLEAAFASSYLQKLNRDKPLIHCMTNDVVQNFTANILLAIGAIPAMVIAKEETADFVHIADSVLINLGTITQWSSKSMLIAAQAAMVTQTPWVLDPVAVGNALTFRSNIAKQLLRFKPAVIRCNASEILALADKTSIGKGPDSQDSTDAALNVAKTIALQYQTVVAMTGKTDYITDGYTTYVIDGGDIALTKVTGVGCALSAVVAAMIGCNTNHLLAAASSCLMMKKAGELADKHHGLGTFAISLLDQLSLMNAARLLEQ
ncbi:hydroxyethylthiazole kinase [Orbus hercynius]|uniref:Hydroxyethylthiazole kinase n=1 Tax=Orbus hercynius TaxID=593135 RepID=A0A495RCM1_9GAMM|nr:hydroxyethylthiazole kinase [Orbus hercynius]RKS84768.1 hydroxyethylthiazole kinase [Orbus hercynius]